jgi:hypothetical protein
MLQQTRSSCTTTSRSSDILRDGAGAEVSKQEIERMIACGGTGPGMISTRAGLSTTGPTFSHKASHSYTYVNHFSAKPQEYVRLELYLGLIPFKHSWEAFILLTLMREWKTLNVTAFLAS